MPRVFCYHASMSLLLPLTFFALGAISASFIGVIVARLYTAQGFISGRSSCDACTVTLVPGALFPILSFVGLGGRASCCGTRLSPVSPISEALLGTLFALAYLQLGLSVALPFMLLALAALLSLVLYDLAHQILPTPLLVVFITASLIVAFLSAPSLVAFRDTAVAALLIAGSLAAINMLSRGRAMGFADAPLSFGLALLTGSAAFPGFIFSFWIGAVIGIVLLARRPRGFRMGVEVPFAPFLASGFLLAYFTQWNPFTLIAVLPW